MLKTIIIDDEQPAIDLLKFYLRKFGQIEIIKECQDGFCGLKVINELKPDLVFLDIQMPKLTGFELLELLEKKPMIIFTTAYDEYAIKAFEINAVDYLLKPFSEQRLAEAITRTENQMKIESPETNYPELIQSIGEKEYIRRIVVKSGHKIVFIPVEDVIYLESEDDYVMIYTKTGKHLKQATMKYFEKALNPSNFFRIHRSFIVRIDQIKQIEPFESGRFIAILQNGAKLSISKSGYKNLKEKLGF
ncbi:MAG: DNA-binding response regulator [Bacteroidetes bacterium 4572_117]|nr:MAG: DNA-binding response regulator [Bacteroidetes bacterium 4572_117]